MGSKLGGTITKYGYSSCPEYLRVDKRITHNQLKTGFLPHSEKSKKENSRVMPDERHRFIPGKYFFLQQVEKSTQVESMRNNFISTSSYFRLPSPIISDVFKGMNAVTRLHSFYQVHFTGISGHIHPIDTCLIQAPGASEAQIPISPV